MDNRFKGIQLTRDENKVMSVNVPISALTT
jgi:hypothetical protein